MTTSREHLARMLKQLNASESKMRRSAAKWLRKAADPRAGSALLGALRREMQDARTWETQYQMIMALGASGHLAALPFLRELAKSEYKANMVAIGIGCALVRLELLKDEKPDVDAVIDHVLKSKKHDLIKGMLVTVGFLNLRPSEPIERRLISFALKLAPQEQIFHIFICSAAHAWTSPAARGYLSWCIRQMPQPISDAARMAELGRRWNCEASII